VEAVAPERRPFLRRVGVACAVFVSAVILWGGYGHHWHWTGLGSSVTLWDWLHLLLLPLAAAVVPLWARHGRELDGRRRALLAATAAGFAVLVVCGYAFDLHWTGFPGNRLWDWLELLVLPLAVASFPVWRELSGGLTRRHKIGAALVVVVFAVVVVGGYSLGWKWTGFQGNTLFNWLELLAAPIALPLLLAPAATAWMMAGVPEDEEPDAPAVPAPSMPAEASAT
jgi:uncharacterized membrane protein